MGVGHSYQDTSATLHQSGLIAYPTEAIFGLGCDPFNEAATNKLLSLKNRSWVKGLILISYDWQSFLPLVKDLPMAELESLEAKASHPITWLVPKSDRVPSWIHGQHDKVAIRLVQHAEAKAICQAFGGPIVSTSANPEGKPPAKNLAEAKAYFGERIDYYFSGAVGPFESPSEIRDSLSHESIRAGRIV